MYRLETLGPTLGDELPDQLAQQRGVGGLPAVRHPELALVRGPEGDQGLHGHGAALGQASAAHGGIVSSAVKLSIGFTIGFHNHGGGPYYN